MSRSLPQRDVLEGRMAVAANETLSRRSATIHRVALAASPTNPSGLSQRALRFSAEFRLQPGHPEFRRQSSSRVAAVMASADQELGMSIALHDPARPPVPVRPSFAQTSALMDGRCKSANGARELADRHDRARARRTRSTSRCTSANHNASFRPSAHGSAWTPVYNHRRHAGARTHVANGVRQSVQILSMTSHALRIQ